MRRRKRDSPNPVRPELVDGPSCYNHDVEVKNGASTSSAQTEFTMTIRPLPDFLKNGDKELGFPHPSMEKRMRARMGYPEPERPVPEFVRHFK